MTTYIERQSDERHEAAEITHWLRGVSSTALSLSADQINADDVQTTQEHGLTPAILFDGVYYLHDEEVEKGFVTDGTHFLVQIPSENQWGFSLADDDQTFPGGFGSGMTSWRIVPAEQVPTEDRERLEWMLTE